MDTSVLNGLGLYFLLLGLFNAAYAYSEIVHYGRRLSGGFWLVVTIVLLGSSIQYFVGSDYYILHQGFRDSMDKAMGPVVYFIASTAAFVAVLCFRKFFASPIVAWCILDFSLILVGYSMTDFDFRAIVAKPDNVPISMLIMSTAFCSWLALRQAVINDERIDAGGKPVEADGGDKVLTWPDLVYTELLAMVIGTVILLVWSIVLKAPLEPPASNTKIPNPSKAPWYFLGLQEMLVYFDPWLAGVVLPTYIIIGLCAIPYIDINKKGNGYYTFKERAFAITTFLYGFVVLWVVLIVLGTFLRGPNWNFFGFYEYWSPYKTEALNNVNLSDYIFISLLGTGYPGDWGIFPKWLLREWPGILLLIIYFGVLPLVFAKTFMRNFFIRMGTIRFMTMTNILLMMAFLPVKMVLRWTLNLKYIVYIPEFFLNV